MTLWHYGKLSRSIKTLESILLVGRISNLFHYRHAGFQYEAQDLGTSRNSTPLYDECKRPGQCVCVRACVRAWLRGEREGEGRGGGCIHQEALYKTRGYMCAERMK